MCWSVERLVHALYQIVIFIAQESDNKEEWKKYTKKREGRYTFQVDLGMQLIEYGIKLDWKDPYDEADKPPWIRQVGYIPCDCGKCFFCKTGKTTGTTHAPTHGRFKPGSVPRGHDSKPEKVAANTKVCSFCYARVRKSNPHMSSSDVKKKCNRTYLGCRACDKIVCRNCWSDFVHTPNNKHKLD
jgi:hypothetical protein